MITIAGVPLSLPTPEIAARIEADITLGRLGLFFNRSWPGFGTVGLALPTHYRAWPPQPPQLNHFYWPNGASRYAFGLFLIHADAVNDIHDKAFGSDGTKILDVDLVLSSEDDQDTLVEKVTTSVTVFPPIPLYRVFDDATSTTPDNGMYLVAVVDQRYYWWDYYCDDFGISESASVSWADVFDSIAMTLDIDIAVGTINADYLKPSRALNLTNEPVPLVLDAVCFNIGHRLVVDYEGNVSTQPYSAALKAWSDEQKSQRGMERTVRAGGSRFLSSY